MADPFLGRTLGEWQVLARIAVGAHGAVYRVRHKAMKTDRAMKLVDPELLGAGGAAGFVEGMRRLASLRHRNLVRVHDCGRLDDGTPFALLELIDGESLRGRIGRAGPLAVRDALKTVRDVAQGLGAAHAAGLAHGSVAPEAILFARERGVERALLVGFAPGCDPAASAAGDVGALGLTLYEAMTGLRPDGRTPLRPPSTVARSAGIEPGLDALVLAMLSPAGTARPADAGAVAVDLDRLLLESRRPSPAGSRGGASPMPAPAAAAAATPSPAVEPARTRQVDGSPPEAHASSSPPSAAAPAAAPPASGPRLSLVVAAAGGAAVALLIALLAGGWLGGHGDGSRPAPAAARGAAAPAGRALDARRLDEAIASRDPARIRDWLRTFPQSVERERAYLALLDTGMAREAVCGDAAERAPQLLSGGSRLARACR